MVCLFESRTYEVHGRNGCARSSLDHASFCRQDLQLFPAPVEGFPSQTLSRPRNSFKKHTIFLSVWKLRFTIRLGLSFSQRSRSTRSKDLTLMNFFLTPLPPSDITYYLPLAPRTSIHILLPIPTAPSASYTSINRPPGPRPSKWSFQKHPR